MAYRRPFTSEQRREAIRAYRSYRKHRARLYRKYPPVDSEQHDILERYTESIHAMADELRKPNKSVDVEALIRADAWARWLAVEYRRLRG
jgi:hypothetical protein